MSEGLSAILRNYLTERKKEALEKGWGQTPEWLFYNTAGNMRDINHLRERVFSKALTKAKLRQIRPHDLRHSYATTALT
jgi:integrase